MSNLKMLLVGSMLCAGAAICDAEELQFSFNAIGDSHPALVDAPIGTTLPNGDFTVQSCCGDPTIFNATEEYCRCIFSLSKIPELQQIDLFDIVSASLRIEWRTGGDTPFDDILQMNQFTASPFGSTTNHSTYLETFDLFELYGKAAVRAAIEFGQIGIRTSNDSFPYDVTVTLTIRPLNDNPLLGDINRDGAINLLDVGPFVQLLATGAYQQEADFNGDCMVDLLDVDPFIAALADN